MSSTRCAADKAVTAWHAHDGLAHVATMQSAGRVSHGCGAQRVRTTPCCEPGQPLAPHLDMRARAQRRSLSQCVLPSAATGRLLPSFFYGPACVLPRPAFARFRSKPGQEYPAGRWALCYCLCPPNTLLLFDGCCTDVLRDELASQARRVSIQNVVQRTRHPGTRHLTRACCQCSARCTTGAPTSIRSQKVQGLIGVIAALTPKSL